MCLRLHNCLIEMCLRVLHQFYWRAFELDSTANPVIPLKFETNGESLQ